MSHRAIRKIDADGPQAAPAVGGIERSIMQKPSGPIFIMTAERKSAWSSTAYDKFAPFSDAPRISAPEGYVAQIATPQIAQ